MNQYNLMKQRHQKDLDNFPFIVAFSKEQLENNLYKLGLKRNEIDKIVYVKQNVYTKKEDVKNWGNMCIRHQQEKDTLIKNDKTGTGFIYDMFFTELNNHEFGYTLDDTDTIESLGYSRKDIESNRSLKNGLQLAKNKIIQLENEKEESELGYE